MKKQEKAKMCKSDSIYNRMNLHRGGGGGGGVEKSLPRYSCHLSLIIR